MRDLINALKTVEAANIDTSRNNTLDSDTLKEALPFAPVLLERINELVHDELVFHHGRLEGRPDYYNIELLRDEGYEVRMNDPVEDGYFEGEIITSKGRISFG